jgi:hypothetical protein
MLTALKPRWRTSPVFNISQKVTSWRRTGGGEAARTLQFPFRRRQTRVWRWIIGYVLLFYSMGPCGLFVRAQSRLAPEAKLGFSVQMDGGSRGVPSHLPGIIYVSKDRIEFQAFPQVEDMVWSCKQIHRLSSKSENATLVAGPTKYRFNLKSAQQATAFIDATHSACGGVPIGTAAGDQSP